METNVDVVSAEVVDAAYHLHKGLGPGLLESVYEQLLAKDLVRRGLTVARQRVVPFEYDGLVFEGGLKIDLLVNECLVVEVKAIEKLLAVHERQTYTYLRLMNLQVALLLNFGALLMKDGIHRIVILSRETDCSKGISAAHADHAHTPRCPRIPNNASPPRPSRLRVTAVPLRPPSRLRVYPAVSMAFS